MAEWLNAKLLADFEPIEANGPKKLQGFSDGEIACNLASSPAGLK
jgi:hypothetical protein